MFAKIMWDYCLNINLDPNKGYVTKEGEVKYFHKFEELVDYISNNLGPDIASILRMDEDDYKTFEADKDSYEESYYSLCEAVDHAEEILSDSKNPLLKLTALKGVLNTTKLFMEASGSIIDQL